ncbi:MAG TPA: YihY/virulence factor BrkB family protein [Vicinamibacterales bacterium]|jgi:membrane protein|nr:YihY/virulence factor BrkB family protein [Vicinamibacterales bacterium]
MLRAFRIPLTWTDLAKRTASEVMTDNCVGLAAQLAYYFFLALFPALLFLVAIVSFIPVHGLLDAITGTLGRVAPFEALKLIQEQILNIAHQRNGGLLTLGMIGTIWSTSSGVSAIIDTLNQAYGIHEERPWWKVKLIALGLTVTLALFIVVSTALVLVGPALAEKVAAWAHLGSTFEWTWKIVQWPVVFGLVALAIALIYYYAPDAEQRWIWITPGSIFATVAWLLVSLGFRFYVTRFTSYNATYGAIGGAIVMMLWFYLSALAVLVGAELNAEIEHASPYGKNPGEKKIRPAGTLEPVIPGANRNVNTDRSVVPPAAAPSRVSDWVLSALVLGEAAVLTYAKLRSRFRRLRA